MLTEVSDDAGFEQWLRNELAHTPLPDDLTVTARAVVADAERLMRRQETRRKVVRRSVVAAAAAVLVGVVVTPLLHDRAPDNHVGTAASCAGAPVRDASGTDRLLLAERPVSGRITVELAPFADCEAHPGQHPDATTELPSPARGRVTVGRLRGMPFYLVAGSATHVSMKGLGARAFPTLGAQTLIWPDQVSIRAGHTPSTLTWMVGSASYTVRLHE